MGKHSCDKPEDLTSLEAAEKVVGVFLRNEEKCWCGGGGEGEWGPTWPFLATQRALNPGAPILVKR